MSTWTSGTFPPLALQYVRITRLRPTLTRHPNLSKSQSRRQIGFALSKESRAQRDPSLTVKEIRQNHRTYFPIDIVPRSPSVCASDSFRLVQLARLPDAGKLWYGIRTARGGQGAFVKREGRDVLKLNTRHPDSTDVVLPVIKG